MTEETVRVLIVEDDEDDYIYTRHLLSADKGGRYDVRWADRLETAVSYLGSLQVDVVLLDVRMPGMSGLALFEHLLTLPWQAAMPVIFLSGHADVPTAVDAVKRGAFDFCEKPFSDNVLVDRIEQALALSAQVLAQRRQQREMETRLASLTERERDVMRLVIEGLPNKLVADQLNISVRTVEVHRSRVFDKMGVKSAVELANSLRLS